MYEDKGFIDEIMVEILRRVLYIIFEKDNVGEFGRKCLWKLYFYEI